MKKNYIFNPCSTQTEKVCDTKDVEQESVTFEKECKEVTSKVCGGPHGLVHPHIIKRDAEAEVIKVQFKVPKSSEAMPYNHTMNT